MHELIRREIYDSMLKEWGRKDQLYKGIEELSELLYELSKFAQSRGDLCDLASELADVVIRVEIITRMYELEGAVICRRNIKLKRLQERLERKRMEAKNEKRN